MTAQQVAEELWKPGLGKNRIAKIVQHAMDSAAHDEREACKQIVEKHLEGFWSTGIREAIIGGIDKRATKVD